MSSQSLAPMRRTSTSPSNRFGSPRLSEPSVPWISMLGTREPAASNDANRLPITPDSNVNVPMTVVGTGGLSTLFAQGTDVLEKIDTKLTIHGLVLIDQLNRE